MSSKRNTVLYIATSLDGYIAREDGIIDWLYEAEGEGDNGYSSFFETIDTVIMGNTTYEHTKVLADEFPYKGKQCYVFHEEMKKVMMVMYSSSTPISLHLLRN